MKSTTFRTASVTAFWLCMVSQALPATLPLRTGEYTSARCEGRAPDVTESIGIYPVMGGRHRGSFGIFPIAENQDGFCEIGKVTVSGTRFSATADCGGGGTRIQYSTGKYRFSYQVLDNQTFISKGKKYVWCTESR